MKTHYYLLLRGGLGVLLACILANSSYAQERFVPAVKFFITVREGGIPRAVFSIDGSHSGTHTFVGAFDSAYVYNDAGTQVAKKVLDLNNILERAGTTWRTGGDLLLPSGSNARAHLFAYGNDYVSHHAGADTVFLKKRNKTTNKYEDVGLRSFGSPSKIVEWGNNTIALVGEDMYAFWDVNGVPYRAMALYNTKTGALGHVYSEYGEGLNAGTVKQFGNNLYATDLDRGKTYRIAIGDSVWHTEPVPVLPVHQTLNFEIIDGVMYAIVGTSNAKYELVRLVNNKWERLLELEPDNYIGNAGKDMKSFVFHKGKLYIGGLFNKVDGVPYRGFITYDIATKVVANAFELFSGEDDPSFSQFDKMYVVDDVVYLALYDDSLFGSQITYALRTIVEPEKPNEDIPALTFKAQTQKVSPVLLSGTGVAGMIITVYDLNKKVATKTVAADGSWSVSIPFTDGRHTVSVSSIDVRGIESLPSVPVSFAVDTKGPNAPAITSRMPQTVPNQPRVLVTFTATCSESNSSVKVFIDNETSSHSVPYQRDFMGLMSFATHVARFVATDSVGHESEYAVWEFNTSTYSDVHKPGQGPGFGGTSGIARTMSAYPNPVTSFSTQELTITDVTPIKEVLVYDLSGRVVSRIQNVGSSEAKINVSGYAAGFYIVRTSNESGAWQSTKVKKE